MSYWNQFPSYELRAMRGIEPPEEEDDDTTEFIRSKECACGRCGYCLCV